MMVGVKGLAGQGRKSERFT